MGELESKSLRGLTLDRHDEKLKKDLQIFVFGGGFDEEMHHCSTCGWELLGVWT